jgi:hypothetical protein
MKKSKLNSGVQSELVKSTASVIPFLIKTVVVLGIAGFVYYKFKNRFKKFDENSSYAPANVTLEQAQAKADAISSSMGWFTNDFNAVADQLAGLNYNGFVRVYNAFGKRTGEIFGGELTLIEWIKQQFSSYEVAQLSSLQNGVFFRSTSNLINPKIIALNNFINQFNENEKIEFINLLSA